MNEMPPGYCFKRRNGHTVQAVESGNTEDSNGMRGIVMKPIRTALTSIGTAAAFALSVHAYAQSAPLPYTLQADPAIPSTTTRQQQDEVMSLITAHLGLWLTRDPNSYPYEKLITEDAVFEYPYADAESSRHVEGRTAVAQVVRQQPLAAAEWKFDDVKLFQTPHPDVFFVQYTAIAYRPTGERAYAQSHLARVTVRNGQIANYYELWDRSVTGIATAETAHTHN